MKKIIFGLITLTVSSNISMEAAIAYAPHNDGNLIAYGASVPEFKASVWINSGCSASRVKLLEDDLYDFYITAAHCVSNHLSPEGVEQDIEVENIAPILFKELLEDGIFDLKKITCENPANVQGKNYPSVKEIIECDVILKWHALVRAAIDIGLIKNCPSSGEDLDNIVGAYVNNKTPLGKDDIVIFEKLKCIIHPSYENEDDDINRDLALCTSYEKNHNLSKYKLKFIKDGKELENEKLVSVSFGARNTTNAISNTVPARQAFNTFIESSGVPELLDQSESQNVTIDERPTGYLRPGDSGGTLLYKNSDATYSLVAVTSASGIWQILDPQFIEEAYAQLVKEIPDEVETAEFQERLDL